MKKYSVIECQNRNISFLFILYMLILVVFVARLFFIQIIKHSNYKVLAENQYWNLSVIPPKRGDIYSSDNFILAGTQVYYLIYAEPKKVENIYETSHQLSQTLTEINVQRQKNIILQDENTQQSSDENQKIDEKEMFGAYYNKIIDNLKKDLYYVVIEHNLTPIEKQLIEEKNIKGIGFEDEPIRFYPEKSIASNVLGFVAYNGQGEKQGYFGIEGALNGDLKGKSGRVLEERDALGNPILIGGYKKSQPTKGRDVVLTINKAIQYFVEKKLKDSIEQFDAKSGCVIIMDPFTGEIIAMANYPTYSPDNFDEEEELEPEHRHKNIEKRNLCISETYEPGSVIKPITISAAIELGKVSPSTTFEDNGPVGYSDYVIDNWDGKHHGVQTIVQLLEKSNNIGAAWVGSLVGAKDLSYFLKEFGLGKKTEVDLEGEDTGVIRDYKTWTEIDTATAAFGQGISATPLQVLNAFNIFANGGFLVQPKIISKIIDDDKIIEIPSKQIKRIISRQTADTMVDLLTNAAESGEAKYFFLKNYYSIAGKTGTAQIPLEGKYHPELTNATFVGFLAKSKKFSMIIKIEEPQSSVFASETSAPLWTDIANEVIKYYGLVPDKTPKNQ